MWLPGTRPRTLLPGARNRTITIGPACTPRKGVGRSRRQERSGHPGLFYPPLTPPARGGEETRSVCVRAGPWCVRVVRASGVSVRAGMVRASACVRAGPCGPRVRCVLCRSVQVRVGPCSAATGPRGMRAASLPVYREGRVGFFGSRQLPERELIAQVFG
jgi:hypothetical protein